MKRLGGLLDAHASGCHLFNGEKFLCRQDHLVSENTYKHLGFDPNVALLHGMCRESVLCVDVKCSVVHFGLSDRSLQGERESCERENISLSVFFVCVRRRLKRVMPWHLLRCCFNDLHATVKRIDMSNWECVIYNTSACARVPVTGRFEKQVEESRAATRVNRARATRRAIAEEGELETEVEERRKPVEVDGHKTVQDELGPRTKQVKDDGRASKVHHGGQPRVGENWRLGKHLDVTPCGCLSPGSTKETCQKQR